MQLPSLDKILFEKKSKGKRRSQQTLLYSSYIKLDDEWILNSTD